MIIRSSRILGTGLADVLDGWVRIEAESIVEVGQGATPAGEVRQVDGWLSPGLVDLHVHGGGGASFQSGEPEDVAAVVGFHRSHGTTTMLASLVTDHLESLEVAVGRLAASVETGLVAGVHLEGPFLSQARCGAHDPDLLRAPTPQAVERLLASGPIAVVTIAPELPGALEAIERIVGHGAVAAVGHTDASYDVTRAAVAAGARLGTHLFNAMRPLHHREPGPVLALLEDPRVTVELINDGVHLHPDLIRGLMGSLPGRVALITDAMAAAGLPDGDYTLGPVTVTVRDHAPYLSGGTALAGSTLTMAAAISRTVAQGTEPAVAIAAGTATPARVLGRDDIGRLVPGARADLVAWDEQFEIGAVWVGGRSVS